MPRQLINFNLPYTIASSQLVLTDHAKQRFIERHIVLPKGINTWHMVESTRDDDVYAKGSITLKHKRSGLVIAIVRIQDGLYKVCTAYWEGEISKAG